jgi:hypothetical protein
MVRSECESIFVLATSLPYLSTTPAWTNLDPMATPILYFTVIYLFSFLQLQVMSNTYDTPINLRNQDIFYYLLTILPSHSADGSFVAIQTLQHIMNTVNE